MIIYFLNDKNIQMKIVVTEIDDDYNLVECANCRKILSEITNDILSPIAEEMFANGNVPIPNFGWFCSQTCGKAYSIKTKINFQLDKNGDINYY